MATSRSDPLRDLAALQGRLNRIIDDPRFYKVERSEPSTAGYSPEVDVFETAEGLTIKADLPGVGKENIQISLEGNVLSIQGERKAAAETKERAYHRAERPVGRFGRSFTLPVDVDTTSVAAGYSDGVLTLQIPKRAEAKPRTIEIR